jgi:eukaryotic-like serine/threonine-protein kinase
VAETLGSYTILDPLGAGSLGESFRARDTMHGRTAVVTIVGPEIAADPARREGFLQDARAAASLSHPSIATLFEIGEDGDKLFVASEYVPGRSLRGTQNGQALNVRRAIGLCVQLAGALAEAHSKNIIHRDLSPDNIAISTTGRAKILDFGLASWTKGNAMREVAARTATSEGMIVMPQAVAYLSPEQLLGERGDSRTDIFSLGVVLFEMLTGQPPFLAETASETTLKVLQATAPAPSTLNPQVPSPLDGIVARALAKSLEARCPSAAALEAELRALSSAEETRAEEAPVPVSMTTPSASRKSPWPLVGALTLLVLAGALWFWRNHLWDVLQTLFGSTR